MSTRRAPVPPETPEARAAQVQAMFGRIVRRYDLMNRFMSAGLDGRWRRAAARAAAPQGGRVLDLGTGTGDLAEALRRVGAREVIGADFSRPMLQAARSKWSRPAPRAVVWLQADALHLPFPDNQFDALTSAFLLRNLVDLPGGLAEMLRVLKPGGRLVALDITQPAPGLSAPLYRFGFRHVVTPLAGLLSGDRAAYRYLPNSLVGFPAAPEIAALLRQAGAAEARFRYLGVGVMALHVACKTEP